MTAIRLLMLTGYRLSEIQTLRWEDVNLEAVEVRLRDGKTGARMVPLSGTAVSVPSALPRPEDNPWVIVGRKPGAHLTDLQHPWCRIRARADLDDVRIHDLWHSFASRALALGESLPMIGKLLGHSQVQSTARYAHLANESVKASGLRVGDSIGAHIAPSEPAWAVVRRAAAAGYSRSANSLVIIVSPEARTGASPVQGSPARICSRPPRPSRRYMVQPPLTAERGSKAAARSARHS